MPSDQAIWHVDVIRIEMQIYLEKQAATTASGSEQDAFVQRIMLDSDPTLAEDLVQSLSAASAQRLLDAILLRIQAAVAQDRTEETSWERLARLAKRLLTAGGSALRPLAASDACLGPLCDAIDGVFAGIASSSEVERTAIERPLFALLISLRCSTVAEPGHDQLAVMSSIAASLVRIVQVRRLIGSSRLVLADAVADPRRPAVLADEPADAPL
jgi:hypothetical protein